jgi:small subunit ribosomal protein S1
MTNDEEDFATLFAASERTTRLEIGQTVDARIVAIGAEVAFVDVGAKGEATIALDELKNDDGVVEAQVGDRIQATIVSTSGGVTLSRRLQRGAATRRQLEDAFRAGLPVEGKVDVQVKGGYTVTIAGLRAFCPASQIDIVRETNPADHLGRVYTFRIGEFRDDGRKFVVSRRAWLEAEQRERAAELRRTLSEGAIVTGRVVSVREFGAFIDLGSGVQGLLHVSEMDWSRVSDPSRLFKTGDEITVKILRLESKDGEDRIALGLKQLTDDPWSVAGSKYPVGKAVQGRVTRLADFGAFIELEPGVEGLLPFAESGVARGADARKAFPIGTGVGVMVVELDAAGRRLRLSVKAIGDAAEAADVRDYEARADAAAETSGFGSLADKLRGALKTRGR